MNQKRESVEPKRRRLEDWHHILVMCLIMAVIAGGMSYLFLHIDLIPDPASQERGLIDGFMQLLFAIASVFFAIIVTIFGYSLIFFRRQKGDDTDARPIRGKAFLELTWTIIPFLVVTFLSFYGARILDQMTAVNTVNETAQTVYSLGAFIPREIPASNSASAQPELVVNVTASRFVWEFAYPGYGINSTYELEVPVNRRLLLNIQSKDVIHSFWVQEWGPKQDAVPGLSPVLRVTPTKLGNFTVQCSQLCGFGHTDMTAPVHVVSEADFNAWVTKQVSTANASSPPPGSHVMIDLTAQNIAFDTKQITVPAGVEVMISFDNKDNGVPHNFSVYTDATATKAIFTGKIITGPGRITYTFTAPTTPGNYFFRCDVHPTIMTGTFTVK
jgi:cytochrome c oxidase subunit 2